MAPVAPGGDADASIAAATTTIQTLSIPKPSPRLVTLLTDVPFPQSAEVVSTILR